MPGRLVPVSRREFIRRMLRLGFEGPLSGGRHEFLVRADRRLIVPNPHRGDISVDLLVRLLDEAGVTRQEWEASA
ncbi:MAG: type II toxin-antitoxin system HicA family toxin [Anaerolineae bacterium]|jgi:predicted RNA binding protein YcfA (HicA-like mRNA interferase family)|uniref:type II toxin-antitoxin system HicA family toxin n=1 Tax=Candidatus Amarolinea dominans TaxID=3140696 RepID=UPI00313688A8|nr:type II toxin-antitoxin system HicA family toxin [Anaerolineae bacterium]MBK9230392.1 type II toxin-antitoxin system HicA family toxin [Anaerolineae bacterium]